MFPSIILKQVQKNLPDSKATVKGHLKAIKKGIIYDQITSPKINNTTATSESTLTIIEEYDSDDDLIAAPKPLTIIPDDP